VIRLYTQLLLSVFALSIFITAKLVAADIGKWESVVGKDRITNEFVNYATASAPNVVYKNLDASQIYFKMEDGHCSFLIKPNFVLQTDEIWLKIDDNTAHRMRFEHQGDWYSKHENVILRPNLFSKEEYSCQSMDVLLKQLQQGSSLTIRFNSYGNNIKDVEFSLRGSSNAIKDVFFMAPLDMPRLAGDAARTSLKICIDEAEYSYARGQDLKYDEQNSALSSQNAFNACVNKLDRGDRNRIKNHLKLFPIEQFDMEYLSNYSNRFEGFK